MKKNLFRFPVSGVLVALMVLWSVGLLVETAQANSRGRRYYRPNMRPNVQRYVREHQPTAEAAESRPQTIVPPEQFETFCEQIKAETRKPTDQELNRCKNRLTNAIPALQRKLVADGETGRLLHDTLKLDELRKTLSSAETPDEDVLRDVWNVMNGNDSTLTKNAGIFNDLKNELRCYRTVKAAMEMEDAAFEKQLALVCDNLRKNIEGYTGNVEPAYGTALTDIVVWLDDIGVANPKARTLANSVLAQLSGPNFLAKVGERFIAVPFKTNRTEDIDVNNVINGTRVVGSGSIEVDSSASLVPRSKGAEIAVLVNGKLNTYTTGRQSVVSLNTRADGTLRGDKRIRIFSDHIGVAPASVDATLRSQVSNVRINAGPIISQIARNQVGQQKPESEAVARANARRQFADRINRQVDERIRELNENYQKKVRQPLLRAGIYPRVFDISSTESHLNASILVGDVSQPGAPAAAPAVDREYDLFLQFHQSAANNLAAFFLSGKTFDEEKVAADLKSEGADLSKLSETFRRDPDQPPMTIEFAQKMPIAVSFLNNRIKAVVRIDSFVQDGTRYPGLDITLLYDVKTEKDGNGAVRVVFEQADAPQAFPRGFDPSGGKRISARHQTIRTIVMKRLDSALQKRFVAEPRSLKGEWADRGQLVPAFAEARDGWISFAWNWVESEKE